MQRLFFLVCLLSFCGCDEHSDELVPIDLGHDAGDRADSFMDGPSSMDFGREDGSFVLDQNFFSGDADLGVPGGAPCASDETVWSGHGIELTSCALRRPLEGSAPMMGVVVSADSLETPFATSGHALAHFRQLRGAGADFVWLLALWSGVEPRRDSLNGAYMARICEQGRLAEMAGLKVFLGMYMRGLGSESPSGIPMWTRDVLTGVGPQPAWNAFWREYAQSYEGAWLRLSRTCAEQFSPAGIQPFVEVLWARDPLLQGPSFDRFRQLLDSVRLSFGEPLVLLPEIPSDSSDMGFEWRPHYVSAPIGLSLTDRRPSPRPRIRVGLPVSSSSEFEDALAEETLLGASVAAWHDGIQGSNALRVGELEPGPLWSTYFDRFWPVEVSGEGLSFSWRDGRWLMRWYERRNPVSVVRIRVPSTGPPSQVVALSDGIATLDYAFDPSQSILTVFADGRLGWREIEFRFADE